MRANIEAIKNYIQNPNDFSIEGYTLDASTIEKEMENKFYILNEVTLLNVFKDPVSLNNSLKLILDDYSKIFSIA